jgi:hypothetical protein
LARTCADSADGSGVLLSILNSMVRTVLGLVVTRARAGAAKDVEGPWATRAEAAAEPADFHRSLRIATLPPSSDSWSAASRHGCLAHRQPDPQIAAADGVDRTSAVDTRLDI